MIPRMNPPFPKPIPGPLELFAQNKEQSVRQKKAPETVNGKREHMLKLLASRISPIELPPSSTFPYLPTRSSHKRPSGVKEIRKEKEKRQSHNYPSRRKKYPSPKSPMRNPLQSLPSHLTRSRPPAPLFSPRKTAQKIPNLRDERRNTQDESKETMCVSPGIVKEGAVQAAKKNGERGGEGLKWGRKVRVLGGQPRRLLLWRRVSAVFVRPLKGAFLSGDFLPKQKSLRRRARHLCL